jgi:hypothetical protein
MLKFEDFMKDEALLKKIYENYMDVYKMFESAEGEDPKMDDKQMEEYPKNEPMKANPFMKMGKMM